MKRHAALVGVTMLMLATTPAVATGLHTCDSGPRENWKSKEDLEKQLTDQGWEVRFIKEDGGCWEVYAIDPEGDRVEAYFHPVTLENVLMNKRGR